MPHGMEQQNPNLTSVCHSATGIQAHQPRTRLSQSREQPPSFTVLSLSEKEKNLHYMSQSFFMLLFMHSYSNYPCIKEYEKTALTDHKA